MQEKDPGANGGVAAGAGAERSEAPDPAATERRGRPGRRSLEDRTRAVLDLLAGKASVDQLARRFGLQPVTIEKWREVALEGIAQSMRQGSGKSARELELEKQLKVLERAFTDVAIKKELLERALSQRPTPPGKFGR